jgi:hypothetical protein
MILWDAYVIIFKNKDTYMKYTFLLTLSSIAVMILLAGCTGQMASVGLSSSDKDKECMNIDKKLLKVDQFLEVVNTQSAFNLDELAPAIPTPNITTSNNKPRMLKDGNKKRADLLAERQKLGCDPIQK